MDRSERRGLSNVPNTTGSGDAQILDSDEPRGFDRDHIPVPAPHVDGDAPRAYELFGTFQIDAGDSAWMSAKHPVDVQEVR